HALSSIDVAFSLGRSGQGETAGSLLLRSETPTADIYTPKALVFTSLDPEIETLYTGSHAVQQVMAPETFLDVHPLSTDSYELRFYTSSAPTPIGANGFYGPPVQAADTTWRVENPIPGNPTSHRLRLTETRDGHVSVHEYQWDASTSDWSLSEG